MSRCDDYLYMLMKVANASKKTALEWEIVVCLFWFGLPSDGGSSIKLSCNSSIVVQSTFAHILLSAFIFDSAHTTIHTVNNKSAIMKFELFLKK